MSFLRLPVIILALVFCFSCSKEGSQAPAQKSPPPASILASELSYNDKGLSDLKAVIKLEKGTLAIKFYPKKAPNTVTRIIQLIQSNFYQNIVFHRVEPHYLVQIGDPTNTGRGGSGFKMSPEFNDIPHTKGTVAMARSLLDLNSADSQFYIALNTLSHLDEKYTVFGKVVEGEDLLDQIVVGDKILSITLEKDSGVVPTPTPF